MSSPREFKIKITTDTEESSRSVEHFGMKMGELKKITRELGHEFPIAGELARVMLNPVMATFTGAIALFAYAKSKLEEWNKALEESEKRAAEHDFLPGIKAQAAALEEGAITAAKFGAALDAIGKTEDTFATKTKAAIDAIHELQTAQSEVNSAEEAFQIAKINRLEKTGKLTTEQAILARAEAKALAQERADALKSATENHELDLKQAELGHAREQAGTLPAAAGAARRKADQDSALLADHRANIAKAEQNVKEAEAAADKAMAAHDAAMRSDWWRDNRYSSAAAADVATRRDMQDAIAERDRRRRTFEGLKGRIHQLATGLLPGEEQAATTAEAQTKANAQRIIELEKEIANMRQALGIRQAARATTGMRGRQTGQIEAGTQILGGKFGGVIDAASLGDPQAELALYMSLSKASLGSRNVILNKIQQLIDAINRESEQIRAMHVPGT